jgi:hypothetical protein
MRRAALVLVALAAAAVPAATATAAPPRPPARLMVEAREFSLVLSRPVLRAGPAIVQLAVRGEDGHDLRLVPLGRPGDARARAIAETRPGQTDDWRGRLSRGRWKLFCSLAGHERLGMRAVLRVR